MKKTLLYPQASHKKHLYLLVGFCFFFIQKSKATTFYVNDTNTKGDIYTTAIGNDLNDGISTASPKLTIKAAYEKAVDGDTIIVDTGSYLDISAKGELLFPVIKQISFKISGVANPIFSRLPISKKESGGTTVFYVDKDKPTDRKTYIEQTKRKKSQ